MDHQEKPGTPGEMLERLRVASYQMKPATPGELLEHFGTKGMRWGVRKEEPTVGRDSSGKIAPLATKPVVPIPPLPAKKQAKVDKFLKSADVAGTRVSEIKLSNEALKGTKNPIKAYDRHINNTTIKQLEKSQKRALKDAEAVQKGKLTSKQKKVIAGAVVVGAVVGYSLYMRGQQSGAFNSWKLMGQARLAGREVPFNMNKELTGKMSPSDLLSKVAKPVNPGYSMPGGKMNCRRSTYAYELRRRGFDVHATTSAVGWGQSESGVINALTTEGKDYFRATSLSTTVREKGMSAVAAGDKRKPVGSKILLDKLLNEKNSVADILNTAKGGGEVTASSSHRVLAELAKQPNGARGEVLFKFPGFGHSMAYEVVDGTPHIFDSQKGTLYNAATKMVESKWDGFHSAEIRRLDNVDLDLNFLTRWATNMGGK